MVSLFYRLNTKLFTVYNSDAFNEMPFAMKHVVVVEVDPPWGMGMHQPDHPPGNIAAHYIQSYLSIISIGTRQLLG